MSLLRTWSCLAVAILALVLPAPSRAQDVPARGQGRVLHHLDARGVDAEFGPREAGRHGRTLDASGSASR